MLEIILIINLVVLAIAVAVFVKIYFLSANKAESTIAASIENLDKSFSRLESILKDEFTRNREETGKHSKDTREEIGNLFKNFEETMKSTLVNIASLQKSQLDTFSNQLNALTKSNEEKLTGFQTGLNLFSKENREELSNSLKLFSTQFSDSVREFNELQRQKFDDLNNRQSEMNKTTEQKMVEMRETVEVKLKNIQDDNNKQLEEMRHIVDEKLHATLEKRLGESFKQVSDRLEQVHKGLGEMQTLATGVGDLKKVLANVKTKGILGEYQLGALLEQVLAFEQYGKDIKVVPMSNAVVEYAIKLPGKDLNDVPVWLPVDSKFPTEDYQALLQAYEVGNLAMIDDSTKYLSAKIKLFAKDIRDKYISPPHTTDFGIMFLPFEGLYAEVLRIPGLFETIQREYKVTITGPTTLAAFLNSLQMGFRTLAIQKRTSEVWDLLRAVKTEFGNFGDILERTKKKLQETSNVIDQASTRSRAIERKLRDVQLLPAADTGSLIPAVVEEDIVDGDL